MSTKKEHKNEDPFDAELTREFLFSDPFMPALLCRPNCCLFCDNCTDIYYDDRGPYSIICSKEGDFETGMHGKCLMFMEEDAK